jgi:hypothetical protein
MTSFVMDDQEQVGGLSARKVPKVAWFVVTVVGLFLLASLYGRLGRTFTVNSDDATGVLEAEAFLQGNYLLHGWTVSYVSFYTTDLPFYIVGVFFRGVHPSLLRDVPAAIYTLTVSLAVWLAGRGAAKRRPAWLGMAVTFILVGLPSGGLAHWAFSGLDHPGGLAHWAFSGNDHIGTTLMILASLWALDTARGRAVSWGRYALFTLALTLAIAGDALALWVAAIPLIIVCAGRILKRVVGWDGPNPVILLGSSFCAIVASKGVLKLIQMTGGFTEVPLIYRFRNIRICLDNLVYLTEGVLDLYGADFFGRVLNGETACRLVVLLGPGFVAYSAYHAFPTRRTPGASEENRADFLCEFMSVAIAVNLAAYVFGNEAKEITSVRYVLPSVFYGAILAGRFGVGRVYCASCLYPGIAMLAVVYAAFFAQGLLSPPAANPYVNLADFLDKKNLKYGYGSYWVSSITTVSSENRVKVRAVIFDGEQLAPKTLIMDRNWYRDTPAHFLVFWTSHHDHIDKTLSIQTPTRTFGPPSEICRVGEHTVLIWDKDITPCLKPPAEPGIEYKVYAAQQ